MIKIRIQIDGNQFGFVEYECVETLEEYLDCIKGSATSIVALKERHSGAIVTIPLKKYVVEAWSIEDE